MTVKQISVFVENKPGKLYEIVQLFAEKKINMRALNMAETSDYGILRLIVDEVDRAVEELRAGGWVCSVTNVIAISIPDEPGSLEKVLSVLSEARLSIDYTYAFLMNKADSACLVIRVADNEAAMSILEKNGVEVLGAETKF